MAACSILFLFIIHYVHSKQGKFIDVILPKVLTMEVSGVLNAKYGIRAMCALETFIFAENG